MTTATTDGLTWHRVHPVTPLIKGWSAAAALLVMVSINGRDSAKDVADSMGQGWRGIALILIVLTLLIMGWMVIQWRVTRYAVGHDTVHLRSGVLFRQQRQARLDRVQSIDISQPLLARFAGLAELRVEVAGGSGSALTVAYVRINQADSLRAELLAIAAGLRHGGVAAGQVSTAVRPSDGSQSAATVSVAGQPTADVTGAGPSDAGSSSLGLPGDVPPGAEQFGAHGAPGLGAVPPVPAIPVAPEHELLTVPAPRVAWALLRSGVMVAAVLQVVWALVATFVWHWGGIALFLLPGLLAAGSMLWARFTEGAGFRVAMSPDGIRLRHGLLDTHSQTVPPGRVQAIELTQGPGWRGPDWWRVTMNVAGYSTADNSGKPTNQTLLPVGRRDDAATVTWLVLPDLGVEDPRVLLDEALSGTGAGRLVAAPRAAAVLDPFGWRQRGVVLTPTALLSRSGWAVRRLQVVPLERMQSVALTQGWLQRLLGIATVHVHSVSGPVRPMVKHLAAGDATTLLDELAALAGRARSSAGPEQWMLADRGSVVR